jgi:branched-chain amino acid transport system ATP-binding protein
MGTSEMTPLLQVTNVSKWFGGNPVLQDISMTIDRNEVVGLIGPNGAGKTTLFNVITGFFRPKTGSLSFAGREITGLKPEIISRMGLCRTFQITKPFSNIPVLQNVMIGILCREKSVRAAGRRAEEILEFVGLAEKKNQLGRNLTISDRKRLEVARGLATSPRLFLLDEVMAGLTPNELQEMMGLVQRIRESGTALLIIEHVMAAIMKLSERVLVLDYGKMICSGNPAEVTCNPDVIKAYLGEDYLGAQG